MRWSYQPGISAMKKSLRTTTHPTSGIRALAAATMLMSPA
jgi:hypothetical protein